MFSYDVQDIQEYLDPKRNRVRLAIQKTEDLTSHANKTMTSSVFRANVTVDGQPETPKFEAAVKKLLFNKQERTVLELDVLFLLTTDHPHKNILQLLYYQNTEIRGTDKTLQTRLTMIFRMMPKTLFHLREQLSNSHDILDIKLYMWQLCVGLDHLRRLRIIHRDIKPSNLLVDPVSGRLTIADFGSAVIYVKCQHLQFSAYAVSRPYRPPELLLGSRHYSCMVDIWSAGCVLAELYIGEPLIYSLHNTADQLRLVYELFGTPTADDLKAMNVEMEALKPNDQQQSPLDQLTKRFKEKRVLDEDNPAEFLLKLLQFNPDNRLHGADLLGDPFFDEVFRVGRRKNGGAVANCVRKEDRIEAIGTEV